MKFKLKAGFMMKNLKYLFILLLIGLAFWLGYMMSSGRDTHPTSKSASSDVKPDAKEWTCSMHPQIRQPKAGKCPICGMALIPIIDTSDTSALPSELKLSPEAEKLAEIETAPVERKFVQSEFRMFGRIAYNEETMAFITARMPGRIDKLFVNYTGIAVKKGDHVAEIYSPDLLMAQQELIQSLNLLKTAKPEDDFAKRILNSVKEKYRLWGFSEEQVQEIITKGKVSDHLTITAPIQGIVTEKNVSEGMYFEKGEKLFTIADLKVVWINLEAYEIDLPWIRYGEDVDFVTEAHPGKAFKGRIAFIQPFLNEATRTVKVRLNADNSDGMLKPGMFVDATLRARLAANGKILNNSLAGKWISPMHPEIVKDGPGKCDICGMDLVPAETLGFADENDNKFQAPLVIPASAPLITGKRAVVYVSVEGKKGVYEGRDIKLGPRAGDYYIVESGLKEGERVVAKGSFKIDSSLQIQAKSSMMSMPANSRNDKAPEPQDKKTDSSGSPPPDEILAAYFAVQKALFLEDLADAVKNAPKLDVRYSSNLASSGNLKTARENFSRISILLYKEISASAGKSKKDIYKFFCPMAFENKGAYWLQESDKTQNPYFGSVMPTCGELQETIPAGR